MQHLDNLIEKYRERIIKILEDKLINIGPLSKEMGIAHQTLGDMMSGKRNPTVYTLRKIKKYFESIDASEKKC